MTVLALFFVSGIWLLQQQSALPHLAWSLYLALILPLLFVHPTSAWLRTGKSALLCLLALGSGFFYAAWFAQIRLADTLPLDWQGRDIALTGVVAEMPRNNAQGQSFIFVVETIATPQAHVPTRILLTTFNNEKKPPPVFHAGERWQLSVRLKLPHATMNPGGFDFEAWALERNLRATGYVYSGGTNVLVAAQATSFPYVIEAWREQIRNRIHTVLGDSAAAAVLTALAIGDQAGIPAAQWQVFTRTGVNHLMSISGLHITMLAGLAFALCYRLWLHSPWLAQRLPARKAAALTGFLMAFAYALLAGYGVPAQRTVYMLGTIAIALFASRNIAPSQLLALALLVVSLLDPWAVLSPGFWLSFLAVALIFFITANRLGHQHWLVEYARVQWAMSIGLVPALLALFQQLSLIAPLANAVAIPLVSFIVIPLTLLGLLPPFTWLLQLAQTVMNLCMAWLDWLSHLPMAVWVQHAPPPWSIVLGMGGILLLLLPRGVPARWLGLLMLLPMFMVIPPGPAQGGLRLIILDVGQGLSIAVQTANHTLLYDAGPDYPGDSDSGTRIIVPALRAFGIRQLDSLILTHDDIDHTGGTLSVLQAIPATQVSTSLPPQHHLLRALPAIQRCQAGQQWAWDGIQFEILHPAPESYALEQLRDNDRGCVLRISTGTRHFLFASDIEQASEQRLLQLAPDKLPATLLVVPHHGSKTSSMETFVQAVHPRYAVFTVGYRNRFHHPNPAILDRYRSSGSELLRSDEDGAIIVNTNGTELGIERYRRSHARYWHQLNIENQGS